MNGRKDKKGRKLQPGEDLREDGQYRFRYTFCGKRKAVYAATLSELRRKEDEIEKDMRSGIDYEAGSVSVLELTEGYLAIKDNAVKKNTVKCHTYLLGLLKKEEAFSSKPIREVRVSDAKAFCVKLHNEGYSKSSIQSMVGILNPAFRTAVEEDAIVKNPFCFPLSDVIRNDAKNREALTPEEEKRWLDFCLEDPLGRRHRDEYIVLLGTGMRVGEFCGLTMPDLDFEKRRIHISRQLIYDSAGKHIESPKTAAGNRTIPMTADVYDALQRSVKNRRNPKKEPVIDGVKGFVFLSQAGTPNIATNISHHCKNVRDNLIDKYGDFPIVTPHVFRHTCASRLVAASVNIKAVQYIMGHSDVGVTLGIYSHVEGEAACSEMLRVLEGEESGS